jgi:hypothetical protein
VRRSATVLQQNVARSRAHPHARRRYRNASRRRRIGSQGPLRVVWRDTTGLRRRKHREEPAKAPGESERPDRFAGVPTLHIDPDDDRPNREDKEKEKEKATKLPAAPSPGGHVLGCWR